MLGIRHLGAAVIFGLLLGLILALPGGPGVPRANHNAPKPSGMNVVLPTAIPESQSVLPPDVVLAAFESNLTIPTGRSLALREQWNAGEAAMNQDRFQPVESAALLGQELPSLFQANLTEPIQRALTPPSISVTPEALTLAAPVGAASTRHRLRITSLGGTVNWRAGARTLNGEGWLTVLPESGSVTSDLPSVLGVEVNYSALGTTPDLFQGLLGVRDLDTGYLAVVPVAVALVAQQSRIGLSDSSVLLTVAGGGVAPPPQAIQIFNRGVGTLNWFVPVSALQPWLNLSSLTGTAGSDVSEASTLILSLNNAAAQALPSGVYQILLPISASEASNSPQYVIVTLQRVPRDTPASPGTRPHGLFFVARQGGLAPPPKGITVANRGGGTITAQFTVTTESGGDWLTVNPTAGNTSVGPFTVQASVRPGTLTPGIYRGTIRATFSAGDPHDIDVRFIVQPSLTAAQRLGATPPAPLAGCTPASMELIANTIGNGASVPISFPKVLVVTLVDSCGEFVNDATVVGSAEGASIPMQALGNGAYSGTWVPQQSGVVPVSFAALHPTLPSLNRSFTVSTATAAEGIQLPALLTDGVVEAAGFTPRRPLAPGGFISLFGSRFSTQNHFASQIPLERELGGVRVKIGNLDAPLHFVGQGQINAQVPLEFQPGANVSIVVNASGRFTAPQTYLVAPAMPGIFVGSTGAAVLDGQSRPVTPENPARIGDVLQIFSTGLGATDPPVATGAAGVASTVTNPVTVAIGGVDAPVVYQGLAPGFVALYQVNITIPAEVTPGDAVPLVISQNGVESNTNLPATIPVRQP